MNGGRSRALGYPIRQPFLPATDPKDDQGGPFRRRRRLTQSYGGESSDEGAQIGSPTTSREAARESKWFILSLTSCLACAFNVIQLQGR